MLPGIAIIDEPLAPSIMRDGQAHRLHIRRLRVCRLQHMKKSFGLGSGSTIFA